MPTAPFRHLGPAEDEAPALPLGRSLITVVGINKYVHFNELTNARNDATAILELFKRCGFEEVAGAPSLFDEQATLEALTSLVREQLPSALQPDDSLVVFYAGHGATTKSTVPDPNDASKTESRYTGYLIPVGAMEQKPGGWLQLESFLDDLSNLPARHVLVILDACESGFALSEKFRRRGKGQAPGTIAELASRASRRVITSATREQTAMDGGGGTGNSLFTETLVDAVANRRAGFDSDYITTTELFTYVRRQVGDTAMRVHHVKQTPDYGYLYGDGRGELVISLREGAFNRLIQEALEAMLHRDERRLEELLAQLVSAKPTHPMTLYLQYRLKFIQGHLDEASKGVSRLLELEYEEGAIPLTKKEVSQLDINLTYLKPLLSIPPGTPPIEVRMLTGQDPGPLDLAPSTPFTFGNAYQVRTGAAAQFEVRNLADWQAHVYFIRVSPYGRFRIGPVLKEEAAVDGLAAGALQCGKGTTISFEEYGPPGSITEFRILVSPERIWELAIPDTTSICALKVISQVPVDELMMAPVWIQIL